MPFPPSTSFVFACMYVHMLPTTQANTTAPLRVPKINLVANCSPGGSLRDPPPRACGPAEPPGQGGRLPPPGDGGHLTDFVPN